MNLLRDPTVSQDVYDSLIPFQALHARQSRVQWMIVAQGNAVGMACRAHYKPLGTSSIRTNQV